MDVALYYCDCLKAESMLSVRGIQTAETQLTHSDSGRGKMSDKSDTRVDKS